MAGRDETCSPGYFLPMTPGNRRRSMEAPLGDPLPYEDEDKPKPDAPRPVVERVDWLVGPEDGLASEMTRSERVDGSPLATPKLVRPEDPDAGKARGTAHPPLSIRNAAVPCPPEPAAPAAPSPTMPAWDHGHRSIPRVRRTAAPDAARVVPAIPETARDFPMDDAEERARISAQMAEQQAREAVIAARPHEVVTPQEFDLPEMALPWWEQVPQLLRFDRRVQLFVLSLVFVLAVRALWPHAEKTVSVAHLKEHADRYADTQVRVGGNVGEVFPVGGSWAYTLVQGRDTIVVFTRTHRPRPREHVVVIGTLSNGYLDGLSRVAIFEATR